MFYFCGNRRNLYTTNDDPPITRKAPKMSQKKKMVMVYRRSRGPFVTIRNMDKTEAESSFLCLILLVFLNIIPNNLRKVNEIKNLPFKEIYWQLFFSFPGNVVKKECRPLTIPSTKIERTRGPCLC